MAIDVGTEAPDFVLRDQNNQEVRLSDFRGQKNVLLAFYPLAFSRTCHGELCEVRDHLDDFANDTTQILTISIDSFFVHKAWADQEGYEFPLLADFWPHGAVAQAYGVFDDEKGIAQRATFVIDKTGTVRFTEVSPIPTARNQDGWRKVLSALE